MYLLTPPYKAPFLHYLNHLPHLRNPRRPHPLHHSLHPLTPLTSDLLYAMFTFRSVLTALGGEILFPCVFCIANRPERITSLGRWRSPTFLYFMNILLDCASKGTISTSLNIVSLCLTLQIGGHRPFYSLALLVFSLYPVPSQLHSSRLLVHFPFQLHSPCSVFLLSLRVFLAITANLRSALLSLLLTLLIVGIFFLLWVSPLLSR